MAAVRVISGTARGMKLKSVPGDKTRPITDRVKEALFNILGADIYNASLLDLFAGTGSVGIEALSRGASFVRFNDRQRAAIKTIKENLATTRLEKKAEVTQMDAYQLLNGMIDRSFDYIFIAPPQYKELWFSALETLDKNINWLTKDGWVIVQIDPVEYKEINLNNLVTLDQRRYGSTLLLFYSKRNGDEKME